MSIFHNMCCGECGIEFTVPEHFYKERREEGKGWFCPNGHERVFRETDVAKLTRERDLLAQRIAQRDDEIAETRRQLTAQKGVTTRLRNRAAAGVCPCCNRSFVALTRHMATKHPEFQTAEIVPMKAKSS